VSVKIRKGDTVEVISGRREEIGKRGEVIKVMPKENRLVVQKVNIRKKHQRQVQTQQGRNLAPGIVEFEGSMDISNVMLVCPKCDNPTRIGLRREDGKTQRVCKHCGEFVD
jgi:large subunit ribosomal protein L24